MSTYFHIKLLRLLVFFVTPRRKFVFYFIQFLLHSFYYLQTTSGYIEQDLLAVNSFQLFTAWRLWRTYIYR